MMGKASRVAASIVVALFVILSLSTSVSAHSPSFPRGNTSLTDAWEVHDPSKSWAVYADLGIGEVNYYRMEFNEGDRILLMLIIPVDEGKQGFLPRMALMGPGITSVGELPPYIVVPSGYGQVAFQSILPADPSFEPFSPSGYYEISKFDGVANTTGTYFVAVWSDDPTEGGGYGFPVGFSESFTIEELILMPFSLVQVYNWTGEGYLIIFLPAIVVLAIGVWVLFKARNSPSRYGISRHLVYWAGILIMGTGAVTASQLVWTMLSTPVDTLVVVTIMLIVGQVAIGAILARKALTRHDGLHVVDLVIVLVLALLALFIWAGYIIGPLMAILGAATFRWGWFRR